MPDVNVGKRVAQARADLGLTQAELATRLGVARSTLAEMETGQRKISADELYRLSDLLRRPLERFFAPGETATLFAFRLGGEEVSEAAREALVRLDNRLSHLRSLERFCGVVIRPRTPRYHTERWASPVVAGRSIAREERRRLQLGSVPVRNLREVLEERAGLLTFGEYVPGGEFSAAFGSDGERSAILINVAHVRGRVLFGLAHEYAHALTKADGAHVDLRSSQANEDEQFAESFAANLLMPLDALEGAVEDSGVEPKDISADQVLMLASRFGVSFAAMLDRLEHFDLVARSRGAELRKAIKPIARSRELGLPDPREEFRPLPETYERMALLAFHRGRITRSRLAEFLEVDPDEAFSQYIAWADATIAPTAADEAASGTHG